jgi:hypothetical protein
MEKNNSLAGRIERSIIEISKDFNWNTIVDNKELYKNMCEVCLNTKQAKKFNRVERIEIELFLAHLNRMSGAEEI